MCMFLLCTVLGWHDSASVEKTSELFSIGSNCGQRSLLCCPTLWHVFSFSVVYDVGLSYDVGCRPVQG